MTTNRNKNRADIYMSVDDKIKLIKKAHRLGVSLSSLLVQAALDYGEPRRSELTQNVGLVAATKAPQFHGSENLNHVNIES